MQVFTGFPIAEVHGRFANTLFFGKGSKTNIRPHLSRQRRYKRDPKKPFKKECQAHKYADWLYQQKDEDDITYWRRKLKAPHMSTYDLWMKECMFSFLNYGTSPLKASISGGFSNAKVIPGGPYLCPTEGTPFNVFQFYQTPYFLKVKGL